MNFTPNGSSSVIVPKTLERATRGLLPMDMLGSRVSLSDLMPRSAAAVAMVMVRGGPDEAPQSHPLGSRQNF